jgi:GTP pyrophosphokinase
MVRIEDIIERVLSYHPKADIGLIRKAYIYSAKVHKGQVRRSGEPYLSHPLAVADILARMRLDVVSVVCGLLHDTVEDGDVTLEDIREQFGNEIAVIIDGLTKLSKLSFKSKEEQQAENMRKMILAMAQDIRVILVKLADRLHNMRTLGYMPPEKQKQIAQETLDIYAPLAARLGIGWLKSELQDLCLYYLEPETYQQIAQGIARHRVEEEKYISEIKAILERKLQEYSIQGRIEGRIKSVYSIYLKMQRRQVNLDKIYDLVAFRIIVKSLKECYEALGMVHSLWRPVPGRFKDYIGMPKPNGYQSLHTTVIGPYGGRIEIQIRTEEMHKIAEEGIAAHWRYKEGKDGDEKEIERFAWLRQLLNWQRELKDPREFMSAIKIDLYPNEVYVFTPKGDVKVLPIGATVVDFAYSIHTEVGHHCAGAKVNGRLVPLRYKLKTGDVVEIITSPKQRPSKDWLHFVKTPRARSRIKRFLRDQEREQGLALGKEICEKEFKKHGLNFQVYFNSPKFLEVAKEFSFKSPEDLILAVSYGRISARQIIHHLLPRPEKGKSLEIFKETTSSKPSSAIKVKGVDGVLVKIAKCCAPVPGDKIIGYITRGQGVSIHRVDCPNIAQAESDRLIEVNWDTTEDQVYPVKIQVRCKDKVGLLAEITGAIAKAQANIIQAETKTTIDHHALCYFTLEVKDIHHLQEITKALWQIESVEEVKRMGA